MQLSALYGQPLPAGVADVTITHVTDDSRTVKAGSLLVLEKRMHPNTAQFVADAVAKGAYVITNVAGVGDALFHEEPNRALVRWAKAQYPQQPSFVTAVTGTNGKTSVAWFYHHLLALAGYQAACVGTMGVFVNGQKREETGFTSPTALKLHEILHTLATDGITHVCLEASSHALELQRLEGVNFCAAGITNITQDHLDFHGDMEHYAAAKLRLFADLLPPTATAVVNPMRMECLGALSIAKGRDMQTLTVGTAQAELVVRVQAATATGLSVEVQAADAAVQAEIPLIGAFQAENLAMALGLIVGSDVPLTKVLPHLTQLTSVPGRMELMPKAKPAQPSVVVDYAHTPDALERALTSLKPLVPAGGKLWSVFGCGGDRDTKKRPLMGEISARLADVSVVTDDNPRTEDAAQVRQGILQHTPNEEEVGDRRTAITHAITRAGPQDMVLIAGKGHESGQIIGKEVLPFDDREVARSVLETV